MAKWTLSAIAQISKAIACFAFLISQVALAERAAESTAGPRSTVPAQAASEEFDTLKCQGSSEATPKQRAELLERIKTESANRVYRRIENVRGSGEETKLGPGALEALKKLRLAQGLLNSRFLVDDKADLESEQHPIKNTLKGEVKSKVPGAPAMESLTVEERKALDRLLAGEIEKDKDRPKWAEVKKKLEAVEYRAELPGDRKQRLDRGRKIHFDQPYGRSIDQAEKDLRLRARREVETIVAKQPFLLYIKKANPSAADLKEAREAYLKDLDVQRRKIEDFDVGQEGTKALVLYAPSVARVLKSSPHLCGAYNQIVGELRKDERLRQYLTTGTAVAGLGTCTAALVLGPKVAGPCFLTVGVAESALNLFGLNQTRNLLNVADAGLITQQISPQERQRILDERDSHATGLLFSAAGTAALARPLARAGHAGEFVDDASRLAARRELNPEASSLLDRQGSQHLKKITDSYQLPVRVVDDLPDGRTVRLVTRADGEHEAIEISRKGSTDNPGRLNAELSGIDRTLHQSETFPAYNSVARDRGLMVDDTGRLTVAPASGVPPNGSAARMVYDAEAGGTVFRMMDRHEAAVSKAGGFFDNATGTVKVNPLVLGDETTLKHVIDHEGLHRASRVGSDVRNISRTGQIQTDKGDLGVEGYRRSMAVDELEANRLSQSHLLRGPSPEHRRMANQAGDIASGSLRAQREILPSALDAVRSGRVTFSPTGNGQAMYMTFKHNGVDYHYFVRRRYISDVASRAIFEKALRDRIRFVNPH